MNGNLKNTSKHNGNGYYYVKSFKLNKFEKIKLKFFKRREVRKCFQMAVSSEEDCTEDILKDICSQSILT